MLCWGATVGGPPDWDCALKLLGARKNYVLGLNIDGHYTFRFGVIVDMWLMVLTSMQAILIRESTLVLISLGNYLLRVTPVVQKSR